MEHIYDMASNIYIQRERTFGFLELIPRFQNYDVTFSLPKAPKTLSKKVLERRLYSTMSLHSEWNASVTSLTSSDAESSMNGDPKDSAKFRPEIIQEY